jgi:hypothetical protein
VEWGGIEVKVESAAPADSTAAPETGDAGEEGPQGPVLPPGPVVFTAQPAADGRVALRPLASVGEDTLLSFPLQREEPAFHELLAADRMSPGSRFTLFAEGARVGTVVTDTVVFRPGRCGEIPVAVGTVELVPAALAVDRFVALPEGTGLPQRHGPFVPREHTYDQRVAALRLASDAIGASGAVWPQSVLETRADMQAFELDGDRSGGIVGSFLFQDALRTGPSLTQAAWSILVVGTGGPVNYDLAYTAYRPVSEGKAAMRFFEQADWDEDGEAELVIEVFGEESRWFMALDRVDGNWRAVHEDRCG